MYSNLEEITLFVDGQKVMTKTGKHIFKFNVPINGVHTIKAVSGECSDEMEITKVSEPNPSYFISADKVRNWFDDPEEKDSSFAQSEYLSLDSTMAEVNAVPEGKAIMDRMMAAMNAKTAGGMGEGVKIPEAMKAIIERQPLRKLLAQGGFDLDSPEAKGLEMALSKIKKG